MLKEGWDVTNLYTIVPLRAANARILIEQSIGRGLRLPYGKRTGVSAVDRLSIVAHDDFKKSSTKRIKPDSPIRLEQVIIEPAGQHQKLATVVSQSSILDANRRRIAGIQLIDYHAIRRTPTGPALFHNGCREDRRQSRVQGDSAVTSSFRARISCSNKKIQEEITARVKEEVAPVQGELAGWPIRWMSLQSWRRRLNWLSRRRSTFRASSLCRRVR